MASIGESGCRHGVQRVASRRAHSEEGGLQGIQTQCPGDTEGRKSSWPWQGSGHHMSHLILIRIHFSRTLEGKWFLICSVTVKGTVVMSVG